LKIPTLLQVNQSIMWWGKKLQVFGAFLLGSIDVAATMYCVCTRSFVRARRQAGSLTSGGGPRASTISDPFGRRINGTEH